MSLFYVSCIIISSFYHNSFCSINSRCLLSRHDTWRHLIQLVCVCVFCVYMLSLSLSLCVCVCVLCVCVSVFINRVDSNAHNSSRDDAFAAHNASHATLCVLEKNGRWRPQTIRENSARKSPCTTRSRRRRRRRLRRSWKTWASREQRGYVCQKRRLNARVAQLLCRM